jgi:tRNA threonylcarbamoyladenosine biosynthesis protein TsaE
MPTELIASVEAWPAFSARFVDRYAQGGFFALEGELGAGKTAFVRSVIEELSRRTQRPAPRVISPSYVIHQLYEIPPSVDHFDFYRLESLDAQALIEVGFYEALDRVKSGGFLFVEWPSRMLQIPKPFVRIEIRVLAVGREVQLSSED